MPLPMTYIPVENSSNVKEFFYDPEKKTLFVRFLNGGHYSYSDVPASVYDSMRSAESKGKFLSSIKGKFKHTRLDGD